MVVQSGIQTTPTTHRKLPHPLLYAPPLGRPPWPVHHVLLHRASVPFLALPFLARLGPAWMPTRGHRRLAPRLAPVHPALGTIKFALWG